MEKFIEQDLDFRTVEVMNQLQITKEQKLFRTFHPIMINDYREGKFILNGNNSSGARIVDSYGNLPVESSPISLSKQNYSGLGFTVNNKSRYLNSNSRFLGTLKIVDNLSGDLRIYQDTGSEAKAIFLAMPSNKNEFKLDLEYADLMEVCMALAVNKINHSGKFFTEETMYTNYAGLPTKPNEILQNYEMVVGYKGDYRYYAIFRKYEDSLILDEHNFENPNSQLLMMLMYRIMLDNKTVQCFKINNKVINRLDLENKLINTNLYKIIEHKLKKY